MQSAASPTTVHFFFDVVCPYAYLASTQIRRICDLGAARLVYRPMLLGGVFNAIDSDPRPAPGPDANAPARPPLPAARVRGTAFDVRRWADFREVELTFPEGHPRRTVSAMRLLAAAELHAPDRLEALVHALYRAYWVLGRDLEQRDVLADIASAHGLSIDLIDTAEVKDRLRATTDEAVKAGVFGAPSFLIETPDGERRLIFGQDRLLFVEQAVRGHLGERMTGPMPRVESGTLVGPAGKAGEDRDLTFFFDFSSPYTYLAATQIDRVAQESGARLVWKPILLGALFKEIGNPIVPIGTWSDPRRRYAFRDMQDWSAHWGVPFRFPSRFPIMTVTALRMVLAAGTNENDGDADRGPDLAHAIFHAYWVEDKDINDRLVLAAIADSIGLDGAALVARTADPGIKSRLVENTRFAVQSGVFGLPSFLVGEELFFGQDRLDFVARAVMKRRHP